MLRNANGFRFADSELFDALTEGGDTLSAYTESLSTMPSGLRDQAQREALGVDVVGKIENAALFVGLALENLKEVDALADRIPTIARILATANVQAGLISAMRENEQAQAAARDNDEAARRGAENLLQAIFGQALAGKLAEAQQECDCPECQAEHEAQAAVRQNFEAPADAVDPKVDAMTGEGAFIRSQIAEQVGVNADQIQPVGADDMPPEIAALLQRLQAKFAGEGANVQVRAFRVQH